MNEPNPIYVARSQGCEASDFRDSHIRLISDAATRRLEPQVLYGGSRHGLLTQEEPQATGEL